MTTAERHLAGWREAGLIDASLQRRILAFEAATPARRAPGRDERPSPIEALLYLGIGIALVGISLLTTEHWHALGSGARLATFGVPAVLCLFAGLLWQRRDEVWLVRGGASAWLASVVLLGGALAVAGDISNWSDPHTALVSAAGVTVLAVALWTTNRSRPQLFGVAGSFVFLAESITAQWRPYHPELAGLLILLVGIAGIVLAEQGQLRPVEYAARLAASVAVLGAVHMQVGSDVGWSAVPALAVGAALVAFSLQRGRFSYLMAGVVAIFFGLVTFIFQHFEHTIGAPAALLLTGCLLVIGVLVAASWRRRLPAPADTPSAVSGSFRRGV